MIIIKHLISLILRGLGTRGDGSICHTGSRLLETNYWRRNECPTICSEELFLLPPSADRPFGLIAEQSLAGIRCVSNLGIFALRFSRLENRLLYLQGPIDLIASHFFPLILADPSQNLQSLTASVLLGGDRRGRRNAARLNSEIIYDRDFDYDYFGFKTLERSYLLKVQGKAVKRPQHMLMRVGIGIHKDDIDSAVRTYHLMSQRWFTHASPTLFNAGTPRPQLSSCFLVCMKDDSMEGVYDTLKQCAVIIGVSIHNIRAAGSYIHGSKGTSNGIVPILRVFDGTARFADQGGGKRKGAFAVYLEPWHADIFEFLEFRKNHGKSNGEWSLFCPNEAHGLADCWGEEFEKLYLQFEREGKAKKVVRAQNLAIGKVTSKILGQLSFQTCVLG